MMKEHVFYNESIVQSSALFDQKTKYSFQFNFKLLSVT